MHLSGLNNIVWSSPEKYNDYAREVEKKQSQEALEKKGAGLSLKEINQERLHYIREVLNETQGFAVLSEVEKSMQEKNMQAILQMAVNVIATLENLDILDKSVEMEDDIKFDRFEATLRERENNIRYYIDKKPENTKQLKEYKESVKILFNTLTELYHYASDAQGKFQSAL
jgi:hypothetical protein